VRQETNSHFARLGITTVESKSDHVQSDGTVYFLGTQAENVRGTLRRCVNEEKAV